MPQQKTITDCVDEAFEAFEIALDKITKKHGKEYHYTWPVQLADMALRRLTSNEIEMSKAGYSRQPQRPQQSSGGHSQPQSYDHYCSGCGKGITEGVFKFSMDKHSKPLCQDCQKK